MQRLIIFIFLALGLTGCTVLPGMKMQAPVRARAPLNDVKPIFFPITVGLIEHLKSCEREYYYRVGPQDVLEIFVWDHPEFNVPQSTLSLNTFDPSASNANVSVNPSPPVPAGYLVNPDGTIYFPMVGSISVSGRTVQQIRSELAQVLSKYVPHPQVSVRVAGFRSKKIYVIGEVNKPGLQPLTDTPMNITDAINLAGGIENSAADTGHIFVIRGDFAYPAVYWLDASSPKTLLLAENFRLHPNDIVFVSTTDVVRWGRVVSQIIPSAETVLFIHPWGH